MLRSEAGLVKAMVWCWMDAHTAETDWWTGMASWLAYHSA